MKNLRVVTYNGHVGIAFEYGAIRWLRRNRPGHVYLLQEAKHVAPLRRDFGDDFHILPGRQADGGMTYVAARRDRFRVLAVENDLMPFGGPYPRYLTVAQLWDRATSRVLVVSSVHVNPLGAGFFAADDGARRLHEKQVQAYADRFASVAVGRVALAGGDWNEILSNSRTGTPISLRDQTAIARMGRSHMRPSFEALGQSARLDDVFFRDDAYVRAGSRETFTVPVRGSDHPAVRTTFQIALRSADQV